MLAEQRYQAILNILDRDGTVKSTDLCELLGSSRETVRRDLGELNAQGLIRRIHGGAMRVQPSQAAESPYTAFAQRKKANLQAKEAIARAAAEYIHDGQIIALDSGTTCVALAKEIKNRFRSLTVISNSLAVARVLANSPNITLLMTGGVYRADEDAFVSEHAALIFSKLNVDTLFLTVSGVSAERGVTYQRADELLVQNAMLDASETAIVIADSSKLGVNSW